PDAPPAPTRNKVVNRAPAAAVSPAADRQHVAHLNRGLRRDEAGSRRADGALQSRATRED
ncbi:hypothetical protein, partial [Couchioplanes caeruleus]